MSAPLKLVPEPELDDLAANLRELLAKFETVRSAREALDDHRSYDGELWRRLTGELGIGSLLVPEAYGGSGTGAVAIAVVSHELGRGLVGSPFLSSVLSSAALSASGHDSVQAEMLPRIAAGDLRVALAHLDPGTDASATTRAQRDGQSWRLRGTKQFVVDGAEADLVLVAAATEEGPTLFHVMGDADGLERRFLPSIDATRARANLTFAGCAAVPVGEVGDGERILASAMAVGRVALAAELAGTAAVASEMAVGYARERQQFGRVIGSFQAVKHACTDMFDRSESAWSVALYGAAALDAGTDDAQLAITVALAHAIESATWVTRQSIQIHGGIGFTWEHDAHLFYRRAHDAATVLGTESELLHAVADLIGL